MDDENLLRRLATLERSAALGAIVGGLAHEWNNIFGRMMGFAELALEEDLSEDLREYLTEVRDAVTQATELSSWLGRFSRRRDVFERTTMLGTAVDKALLLVRPELKADGVRVERSADGPWDAVVRGDEILLAQAFVQMALVRRAVSDAAQLTLTFTIAVDGSDVVLRLAGSVPPSGDLAARLDVQLRTDGSAEPCRTARERLRDFSLLVPRAIAQFHDGDLLVDGSDVVVRLPRGE